MEKINGICIDGKFFEAVKDNKDSCMKCDLIEEDGSCVASHLCYLLGPCTIFRHSPELTERLNNSKTKEQ